MVKIKYKIDHKVSYDNIKLLDKDKKYIGIYSKSESIRLAHQEGLNLIEIAIDGGSSNGGTSICRIYDIKKFLYEQNKATSSLPTVVNKEVVIATTSDLSDITRKLQYIADELNNKGCSSMLLTLRQKKYGLPSANVSQFIVNFFISQKIGMDIAVKTARVTKYRIAKKKK